MLRKTVLACVAAAVVVMGSTVPAWAQGDGGAPQILDLWFGDDEDCSAGPPSVDTCSGDPLLELELAYVCMLVYDPDFIIDDTDDEIDEQLWFSIESFWIPYFRGGLVYGPEPPVVFTDDATFARYGPVTNVDPTTGLVTVSLPFLVPQFLGTNQARLRGWIDWDVRWQIRVGVANETNVDEGSSDVDFETLDVFVCARENPAAATPNPPPFADAGANQVVAVGRTVQLDASLTFDGTNVGFDPNAASVFEKDILTYSWEWLSGPERVDPVPVPGAPPFARVTLTERGTYLYRVAVSDGVNSPPSTDTMNVTVVNEEDLPESNLGPRAIITEPAGPVGVGGVITLDGSQSADPDGDTLSHRWRQTNELGGDLTQEELLIAFQPVTGLSSTQSTWRAITTGTFYFRLLVSDPFGNTASDLVAVEVVSSASAAGATFVAPYIGETSTDEEANRQPAAPAPAACGVGILPLAIVPACLLAARRRIR